jgi:ADP-heptose:LPS heptosyltransferase
MRILAVDREALVLRNQKMAEAFHQPPLRHRARRTLLTAFAAIPFIPQRRMHHPRILLIRPDHIGNVLLSTPAIAALRRALPETELHALVGPWSADVLGGYAELDAVLTLDFPGFSRTPKQNWRSPYELALHTASGLRRVGYDAAIILRPDHWWGALVSRLAGIPRRIGYNLPDVSPYLSEPIKLEQEHTVLQSVRLIETLLRRSIHRDTLPLTFTPREIDHAWIQGYLEGWQVESTRKIIAIHPGSGTWVKQWEETRWAVIADALHEQLDAEIIFTGDEPELPMISRIIAQMKHIPTLLVGDATIGQLAALYARCAVVIGPDGGTLHLASAVGTPTVTLFGPADPQEYGIWGAADRHIMLTSTIGCRPCRVLDWGIDDPANHPCLRDISIDRVLNAARRLAQRDRF